MCFAIRSVSAGRVSKIVWMGKTFQASAKRHVGVTLGTPDGRRRPMI
jgi:hypothetical protein